MSLENLAKVNLKDNSLKVLNRRYLRKNEKGEIIETPEQLFERVAEYIALGEVLYASDKKDVLRGVKYKNIKGSFLLFCKDEEQYNSNHRRYISNLRELKQNYKSADRIAEDIYNMMVNFEFMPNSPTLMNADTPLGQLSACFVLPIEDSMDSIFQTLKDTAMIHKSGGGTGFSFSRLRPKNAVVKSTGGIASGPVSFMKVYDSSTEAVKQGGTRRGANMGILRVDHPDILDFIKCKEQDKQINNFNISVAITDEFMKKAENNEYYNLIDPRTRKEVEKLNAREVFDLITKQAHKNGEPGVIFIDRINQYNPTRDLEGEIESTNPCGEQPLLPYESCNLGSINLGKFVKGKEIDKKKLEERVEKAVRFMDNVIDLNKYPLAQIEERTKKNRKIGLGVMGFADMLIDLGIPYNSDDAVDKAEEVMHFINEKALEASERLAEERGVFPNFNKSIYAKRKKRRNAAITTIAPTGTISIIANDCSSGIEPFFALVYERKVEDSLGERLFNSNERFENIARERGFYSEELMEEILKNGGSVKGNPKVPLNIQKLFVTARDTEAEYHVRMQAEFQKHTDNAVSKTINFPNSATIDDVKNAYLLAYNYGCKGITIYRDGSREKQVLVAVKKEGDLEKIAIERKIAPRPRPEVLHGTTTKVKTGCGNLYITINEDEKGIPFELFTQMGKAGGCAASQLEAEGRLVSLAFRSNIDHKEIIQQLKNIRCPSPTWEKGERIFSCADAIAKVIEKRYCMNVIDNRKEEQKEPAMKHSHEDDMNSNPKNSKGNMVGVCPDCGSALNHEEGCVKCGSCGFSKC
jgi:ribonucleoside-diphosphate reductase alpha chain